MGLWSDIQPSQENKTGDTEGRWDVINYEVIDNVAKPETAKIVSRNLKYKKAIEIRNSLRNQHSARFGSTTIPT